MLSKPKWVNWTSRHDERRGQSVVEFALVMPVLLLLLAGIVDLGDGFQTYIALTNAAREGAHWGMIHVQDTAGIRAHVRTALPLGVNMPDGNISVTFPTNIDPACTTSAAKVGCPVQVTVTYTLNTLLGGVLGFDSFTLNATATMDALGL